MAKATEKVVIKIYMFNMRKTLARWSIYIFYRNYTIKPDMTIKGCDLPGYVFGSETTTTIPGIHRVPRGWRVAIVLIDSSSSINNIRYIAYLKNVGEKCIIAVKSTRLFHSGTTTCTQIVFFTAESLSVYDICQAGSLAGLAAELMGHFHSERTSCSQFVANLSFIAKTLALYDICRGFSYNGIMMKLIPHTKSRAYLILGRPNAESKCNLYVSYSFFDIKNNAHDMPRASFFPRQIKKIGFSRPTIFNLCYWPDSSNRFGLMPRLCRVVNSSCAQLDKAIIKYVTYSIPAMSLESAKHELELYTAQKWETGRIKMYYLLVNRKPLFNKKLDKYSLAGSKYLGPLFLTLFLELYLNINNPCLLSPLSDYSNVIHGDSDLRVINELIHDLHALLLQFSGNTKIMHVTSFLHRYDPTMPANKRNRDPQVRDYDPLCEAQTPSPSMTWERWVNKTSLVGKKHSGVFKIPKTVRQEPGTVMPNPPYEALTLTYAESRKSKARAATGAKRGMPNDDVNGTEAKKAHLRWLHEKAIPDMDREIMKTNVLVDNILTEQNELITQMLAIKAMGGEGAYNEAYKAHDGLCRAIEKWLHDTKKKRAKQFEAIRSMRTMLRTLVAEIDDNIGNRKSIQRSCRPLIGTAKIFSNKSIGCIYYELMAQNSILSYLTGPDTRSLLRPEINRDN